jgi:hypothetical protein
MNKPCVCQHTNMLLMSVELFGCIAEMAHWRGVVSEEERQATHVSVSPCPAPATSAPPPPTRCHWSRTQATGSSVCPNNNSCAVLMAPPTSRSGPPGLLAFPLHPLLGQQYCTLLAIHPNLLLMIILFHCSPLSFASYSTILSASWIHS